MGVQVSRDKLYFQTCRKSADTKGARAEYPEAWRQGEGRFYASAGTDQYFYRESALLYHVLTITVGSGEGKRTGILHPSKEICRSRPRISLPVTEPVAGAESEKIVLKKIGAAWGGGAGAEAGGLGPSGWRRAVPNGGPGPAGWPFAGR
jgi:hypothetical protein